MLWIIVSACLIFLGIAGTLLPLLPGPPLVLAGLLVYGLATDFAGFSLIVMIIFAGLVVLSLAVDFAAPALGARGVKAHGASVLGAVLGGFLGVFVIGPAGVILGPLAGAFLGEYYFTRDLQKSARVSRGVLLGFLLGVVVKLGIGFGMLGYFIYLLLT